MAFRSVVPIIFTTPDGRTYLRENAKSKISQHIEIIEENSSFTYTPDPRSGVSENDPQIGSGTQTKPLPIAISEYSKSVFWMRLNAEPGFLPNKFFSTSFNLHASSSTP